MCPPRVFNLNEPEIGDVDERIVERGEDAGDAEDEFTWRRSAYQSLASSPCKKRSGRQLTFADLGAQGDVLLGGAGGLLWGHLDVIVSCLVEFFLKVKRPKLKIARCG